MHLPVALLIASMSANELLEQKSSVLLLRKFRMLAQPQREDSVQYAIKKHEKELQGRDIGLT